MKLTDNCISQIVRVLQLALLTGTDITDNMRMMRFSVEEDVIDLDSDYLDTFDKNLEKLNEAAMEAEADE